MLQYERFEIIEDLLEKNKSVRVADLARTFNVSLSTIRRDINDLANQGRLKKVFGGAVPVSEAPVPDMAVKSARMVTEKLSIAEQAAALIAENDFVFIDAGTTTGSMIDLISEKTATYVTNGVHHAQKLAARGFTVYVLPGKIRPDTEAVVGQFAVDGLSRYNFTKCFLGVDAIDLKCGLTTSHVSEAKVKAEVMKHSREVFILADRSKFDRIAPVQFGELTAGIIITDCKPDDKYLNKINLAD